MQNMRPYFHEIIMSKKKIRRQYGRVERVKPFGCKMTDKQDIHREIAATYQRGFVVQFFQMDFIQKQNKT